MPAFGGLDGRSLFVTSLREGRSEAQLAQYPLSGTVFQGRAFVAGVPAFRFRDA